MISLNWIKVLKHDDPEWGIMTAGLSPCYWYFLVHTRHTRPGRRFVAQPGVCWGDTPGIGWCLCQCKNQLGRERRTSRHAGSSEVPERRHGTLMPPRQSRSSSWWSRSSPCQQWNDGPIAKNMPPQFLVGYLDIWDSLTLGRALITLL